MVLATEANRLFSLRCGGGLSLATVILMPVYSPFFMAVEEVLSPLSALLSLLSYYLPHLSFL